MTAATSPATGEPFFWLCGPYSREIFPQSNLHGPSLDLQRLPMTASTAHSRPHLRAEQPPSSHYSQSLSASSYADRRFRPRCRCQFCSLPIWRPLSALYAAALEPFAGSHKRLTWHFITHTSKQTWLLRPALSNDPWRARSRGPFMKTCTAVTSRTPPGSRGHSCSPPVRLSQLLGRITFSKHNKFPSFISSSLFVILSAISEIFAPFEHPAF
jgi:hypothetical protein